MSDKKPSLRDRRRLLRAFRKQTGLTLVELGRLADLSNPMLSQFENGNVNLSEESWARLLAAMEKFLLTANAKMKADIAKAGQTAAKLGATIPQFVLDAALNAAGIDPFAGPHVIRGAKEALQYIDLTELLGASKKVLEEKTLQAARLEHLSSIDDPIVAEIIESLRREIAQLEQQVARCTDSLSAEGMKRDHEKLDNE